MSCCGPKSSKPLSDDEMPSEADLDRFGGDGMACPSCGCDIYHDATQCHTCGIVLTDDLLRVGKPMWVPLTAGLLVIAMVIWVVVL